MTKNFKNAVAIRSICFAITALCLSHLVVIAESVAAVVDRVVAEVNDDVVTLSELNEEGSLFLKKVAVEVPADQRDNALQKAQNEILDGLIDKILIAQEAAKNNLSASDEEIDGAIDRIAAANKVSREQLYEEVLANGLSIDTYRNNVKSQILQNKLVTREISSKIVITEDMILDYYDTEYTKHVKEGSYYLLQIGISWGETAQANQSTAMLYEDKMAALKKAERIQKLAASGQDFGQLARKFSDLPSASDGGDIGLFELDELASYMKDAVKSLKPGEISRIVETPVGFQFFKLLSDSEGGIVMQAPYDTVKEEIREKLFRKSMEKEYRSWIEELKKNSYVKKML